MKMQFGLYAGGPVSASFLARLPNLAARLGPVASPSYRVASRIVNTLRAGKAVKDCAGLDACALLLVSLPGHALPAAIARLAASEIRWPGKVVLLCQCGPGSRTLDPLRQKGAAAGSLNPIEGSGGRYVAEGDAPAVREARRIVQDLRGRTLELHRAGTALYGAGLSFATSLFTPLIAASMESLRKAGCNPTAAARVTEALFQSALRAWAHSGKKSWAGPLAEGDDAEVSRQIEALAKHDPRAARYYRQSAAFALEYFQRHPDLLKLLGT